MQTDAKPRGLPGYLVFNLSKPVDRKQHQRAVLGYENGIVRVHVTMTRQPPDRETKGIGFRLVSARRKGS